MKKLTKIAAALGAIASLTGAAPASAAQILTSLTNIVHYSGEVTFKFEFADSGTIYNPATSPGTTICSDPASCDLAAALNGPGSMDLGAAGHEDTWGILNVTNIIVNDGVNTYEWYNADNINNVGGKYLRGMFYGGVDQEVTYLGAGFFQAFGTGAKLDLYQYATDFPANGAPVTSTSPATGPGGRTGLSSYTNFTDGTGTLWADLVFDTFTSEFKVQTTSTVTGQFTGNASVGTGGTLADQWLDTTLLTIADSNFPNFGDPTDTTYSGTGVCSTNGSCAPWTEVGLGDLVATVHGVPEPGSLALLGMSLMGLAGLRQRKMK